MWRVRVASFGGMSPRRPRTSWSLEPQVFVRRGVREGGDQVQSRLLHPWSHAANERVLPDRSEHHAVVEDPRDLMERLLALPAVRLPSLTLEEIIHLREDAYRIEAASGGEALDPRGGIAGRPQAAEDQALELLVAPRREEGGPLHRADLRPDPDRRQVAADRLAHGVVGRVDREVAGVESARIAGLGQELTGPPGVVRVGFDRQRELHVLGDHVAGQYREVEELSLGEGPLIDGQARGQPHATVTPRRLRIPLVPEVESEHRIGAGA